MSHSHSDLIRAVPDHPGWSLLRLSAVSRTGLALGLIGALWLATLAVIL